MLRKNKALLPLLLLVFLSAAPLACSSNLGGERQAQVSQAEDGGEEEVLTGDEDLDEFGRPKADERAGGVLVAIGYVGMILGSALLPFLLFL